MNRIYIFRDYSVEVREFNSANAALSAFNKVSVIGDNADIQTIVIYQDGEFSNEWRRP